MNDEIRGLYRTAGSIAAQVRNETIRKILEGESLLDIANFVESRTTELGAGIAFPCNLSLNDTASHFTPCDNSTFKNGDVVKLDIGVHVDGYIADTATTIEVGTNIHKNLINTAELALENAIKSVQAGVETKEISSAIENTIINKRLNPVLYLSGHGLDRYDLHSDIKIPNYSTSYNCKIKNDHVLAIEPFVTYGTGEIMKEEACIFQVNPSRTGRTPGQREILKKLTDRFGTFPFAHRWLSDPGCLSRLKDMIREFPVIKECDGNIVAQAEHTVIVDEAGCEVLTR
ncbi:MAG: type II methionyl aminopeptidase [Candidatus Methanoperedenaceae archaeon]|nr:MAG: type II methionyl aminopeptidase [Candidatus Methanoperedenaceae archaeon]